MARSRAGRVLARRKWYLLTAVILTTSAALLLAPATPPGYRSEVTLLLSQRPGAAGATPAPLTPQVAASLAEVASDRATALAVLRR